MDMRLINHYDVWGNQKEGYEVNDSSITGIVITVEDTDTDKDIINKLIDEGFFTPQVYNSKKTIKVKVELENLGEDIEIIEKKTGKPIASLASNEYYNY